MARPGKRASSPVTGETPAPPTPPSWLPARHKNLPVVYVPDRPAWRDWLATHGQTCRGIWLAYPKKSSGRPRVSYDDAVEEALCFGWIDSTVNALDADSSLQLFTPRKRRSTWSALNKRRIETLTAQGLITPAGQVLIDAARADGSWSSYDVAESLEDPPDLKAALRDNKAAAKNWAAFSPSSRKGILWWIHSAKRPETRAARVATTVRMAALGLRAQFDKDPAGKANTKKTT